MPKTLIIIKTYKFELQMLAFQLSEYANSLLLVVNTHFSKVSLLTFRENFPHSIKRITFNIKNLNLRCKPIFESILRIVTRSSLDNFKLLIWFTRRKYIPKLLATLFLRWERIIIDISLVVAKRNY